MLQGVLDAAERLAALGLPLGSRVRAFFLKAPHSFSEVAAKSEVSRDSIVKLCHLIFCTALGLQGRGARECECRNASSTLKLSFCRPAGRSTCSRLWLKRPTEGVCRGRNRRRRGL